MRARSVLFGAVLLAGALPAQPTTAELTPLTTFRLDTRLVVLNVSVLGPDGNIVKGIPESAFSVFEDGQKQEIKVFRQEDVPISLGLIVDNSESMGSKRERVISAVRALMEASNHDDEVFVVNFNENPKLVQDFTSNVSLLEASLRKIDAAGETAMRDALREGLEHLRVKGRKDKKVLLVVTDGEDNASVEAQQHLVQVAYQSNVIIYAIGLLGGEQPQSAERARKSLEELTLATGGRAWFPADVAEITQITPEIAHEIRNQYVVGYEPANQANDGAFRKIRVEVNVPDVHVRTRSGYYAPVQ
ncbi:MAG TPA: VWA domain-containing protein [Bryobacteraceae bacterium]|nr:VWA domain-containing protein [Bryobacteraceae bacterium]